MRRAVPALLGSSWRWVPVLAAMLVLECPDAQAKNRLFAPREIPKIIPPYPETGVAQPSELKRAAVHLSECRQIKQSEQSTWRVSAGDHHRSRTAEYSVLPDMDMGDRRLVNGLVVQGLLTIYKHCFSPDYLLGVGAQEFSGARVRIKQGSRIVVETGRIERAAFYREIKVPSIRNIVIEERAMAEKARLASIAAAERDRRLAQERAESEAFWSNVRFLLWSCLGIAAFFAAFRYGPIVIGYVRYMFMPHPAKPLIFSATRGDSSLPLSGKELAASLRYRPASVVEAKLATRDLRRMSEDVRLESEFLRESETLARMAMDMERQRARVEELKKAQGSK